MYGKGASSSTRLRQADPGPIRRRGQAIKMAVGVGEQAAVVLVVGIVHPLERVREVGQLVFGHDQ